MKNFKLLMILFLGVALSTAYSCKKDDTTDDDGGGGGAPTACYIKKEINDDGSYATIEYNAKNQVIKYSEFDDKGASDGYTQFTYTNDLVSKMEEYQSGSVTTKLEYTYNAQSKPLKAKLFIDQGTGLSELGFFEFTFSGDDMTEQSMTMDVMGQTIKVSKTTFTYDAGNVTIMKSYSINMTTLQMDLDNTSDFVYDGKINPYHGVGIDYLMGDPQFLSKANPTKITISDDQGAVMNDESYNIVYEYKDAKYPTKSTATSFDNSDTEVTTMEYDCK